MSMLEEKHLSRFFLLVTVLSVAARFVCIELDPPNITFAATFFTDEGVRLKNALTLVRFGDLLNTWDYNIYPGNPLYTFYAAFFFSIFGVSLTVARAAFALLPAIALLYFYNASRRTIGSLPAAAAAMMCALSINLFTFGRLANPDPAASSLALIGLSIWMKKPGGLRSCGLSLFLAVLAASIKTSYVFALGLLLLLWGWDAVTRYRADGDGRRLSHDLFLLVFFPALFAGSRILMQSLYPEAYRAYGVVFASRLENLTSLDLGALAASELSVMKGMGALTNSSVLVFGTCLGMGSFLAFTLFRKKRGLLDRGTIAFVLWLGSGTVLYGLADYQPPRYFVFAIYPLAYLCAASIVHLLPKRRHAAALLVVAGLYAASQYPLFRSWLSAGELDTFYSYGRDACRTVRAGHRPGGREEIVVAGAEAGFLALFCGEVRPLELHYVARAGDICREVSYWQPDFVLNDYFTREGFVRMMRCPDAPRSTKVLKRYRPMPGYATHMGAVSLIRLDYGE